MSIETFLGLLQFSDGLFPVGSYAHSFGLESYAAAGTIRDAAGVRVLSAFAPARLRRTLAMLSPRSWHRGSGADAELPEAMERCLGIDRSLDAMKPASEIRDASRQMGRQVLRIAATLGEPFRSHMD